MPKYHVERSLHIDASPDGVFETIADFRTWTTWSPWLLAEPNAHVNVTKDPASVGSRYAWEGNIVGAGELEHVRLTPGRLIDDELRFFKPFKTTCKTAFELTPQGGGTMVKWTMEGNMPWFLFFMIPMMKTFIGMDYQRGLTMLKDWIEIGTILSKTEVHGVETFGPLRMAGIAGSCSVHEVEQSMDQDFLKTKEEWQRCHLPHGGWQISVYTAFRVKEGRFEYICGFTLPSDAVVPSDSQLTTWSLPMGKVFRVEHIGSYRHLGNGWSVANQLARHEKLRQCRYRNLRDPPKHST
jgi:hypothetical protein